MCASCNFIFFHWDALVVNCLSLTYSVVFFVLFVPVYVCMYVCCI